MLDTPCYVFDTSLIRQSYFQVGKDLTGCLVHYCLKANGEPAVVRTLADAGARFEVSGTGEFNTVLEAGVTPKSILCGLPVKPVGMVRDLYEAGCRYFTFDSVDELRKLEQHAPEADKALRLNVCHLSPDATDFGAKPSQVDDWIRSGQLSKTVVTGLAFDLRRNTQEDVVVAALDLCQVPRCFSTCAVNKHRR